MAKKNKSSAFAVVQQIGKSFFLPDVWNPSGADVYPNRHARQGRSEMRFLPEKVLKFWIISF